MDSEGQSYEDSSGNEAPTEIRFNAMLMPENLEKLCPCPSTLWETKPRGDELAYQEQEMPRQHGIQTNLTNFIVRIGAEKKDF